MIYDADGNLLYDSDVWKNTKILHIGTSISSNNEYGNDGSKYCTWFSEAMKNLGCENGVNTARSGRGAVYFAGNYDERIAPYISDADIFTIEHYINDTSHIGVVADMEADENGEYDITTYYGAMAYIITRARIENMYVKIGLLSHWYHENIDEAILNVAEKFNLPILDVNKMIGASTQEVESTQNIWGEEFTGTHPIKVWYSIYPNVPNGDGLHPFNEHVQQKYAVMYANWLRSW